MNDTAWGPSEGSQFGHYYLKRLIGDGGIGKVYKAEDAVKHRTVALKVLPPVFSHDLVFCARLQRQARTVGRLQQPHLVPIHDYGEINGQQFLDMRLIEGTDLSTLLKESGALSAPRAVAIVRQIATALDAASAAGVMHGDVKPENILITRDDFGYLVDLGITDAAARDGVARVVGSAVRTWKYTAPERFTDSAISDKVDIYALTCVLYECLTGSPPYWADSAGALISAHLMEPVPRPSQLQPAISSAFDDVIARGMAKDPLERYASAGDLAQAAYQALSEPDRERAADVLNPSPTSYRSADPPGHPPKSMSAAGSTEAPDADPRLGFGSSGPSSEFGTHPPVSPWAAPRKHRRHFVLGAVAVVALAVVGGVAIWLLRPSHPSGAAPGPHGAATTPTPSDAAAQARLLSALPRGYPPGTCQPVTPPQDALSKVSCDKNAEPDGPSSATYVLFPDVTSVNSAFRRIVQGINVIDCPGRIQSPGPWHHNASPNQASGMLLCGTQRGKPMVAWTNDAELLVSVVKTDQPGPTMDQLYAWWMLHS